MLAMRVGNLGIKFQWMECMGWELGIKLILFICMGWELGIWDKNKHAINTWCGNLGKINSCSRFRMVWLGGGKKLHPPMP